MSSVIRTYCCIGRQVGLRKRAMPFVLYHRAALTTRHRDRIYQKEENYQQARQSIRNLAIPSASTTGSSSTTQSTTMPPPTPLSHVLETCLYVKHISASQDFYTNILGLVPDFANERMCVYPLGHTTIILFTLGHTYDDSIMSEDGTMVVPKHGPEKEIMPALLENGQKLRQHYCLAVETKLEAQKWEEYLREKDVPILGKMAWQRGGYSVYFTDPDGHVGEIGSRGIWKHY